jgi:hypothetical protein
MFLRGSNRRKTHDGFMNQMFDVVVCNFVKNL